MSLSVDIQQTLGDFSLAVAFEAPAHGVTALFGPSGAGKTQTLRVIAGLEAGARADIRIGEQRWQDENRFVAPHKRAIGYLFQEASLFEHLDVAGNIDYGLKRLGNNRATRRDELVSLLGLQALLQRRPATLSGGERQRVALARALAPRPALLLMDEPLAALDQARKAEILPFLDALFAQLKIPVLLVSHDHDEVARLANHLVLLEQGRVTGSGPLDQLLTGLDLPLARAMDAGAVLQGTVSAVDTRWSLATVSAGGHQLLLPAEALRPGDSVRLRIASRDVSLVLDAPRDSSILNVLPVTIRDLHSAGALVHVQLGLPDGSLMLSCITAKSANDLQLAPGKALHAQVKGVAVLP